MRRLALFLACVATGVLVSACASSPSAYGDGGVRPVPAPYGEAQAIARLPVEQSWTPEDFKYRLSPGDEVGVRFLLSPDLNAQVTIGPDGRAVLPLVASVKIAGLTVEQADAVMAQAYASYLRKPYVELMVYTYAGGQVYVAGEVKTPGARPIKGQVSIVQAIQDGGGFLDTAKVDSVVLLRRRPSGQVLMRRVDVKAILAGRTADDVLLMPGDVVFVPRSSIAEVDRIVKQYITGVIPLNLDYQLNGNVAGAIVR